MNFPSQILMFSLLFSTSLAQPSNTSLCSHLSIIDCDLSSSELLHNLDLLRLPQQDALFILILSPFSLFSLLFVILTSFYYKSLLDSPGDIILALSINEFLKITIYFLNALYYFLEENGPLTNSAFCQLTGSFLVISQYIEDYYNLVFCLFILIKIRYLLKEAKIPQILYHLLLVLAIIAIGVLLKQYGRIGKSYSGICGLKACLNAWAFAVIFLQILNVFLVTLTLKYFVKSLPNYVKIRKIKAEIINYLGIYLIGQTVARILFEVFQLILQINSYRWKWEGLRNLQFLLYFKMIVTPLLLLIMRYNHLFLAEIFSKIFFCKYFYTVFLANNENNENNTNLTNLTMNSHEINKNLYTDSAMNSAPKSKTISENSSRLAGLHPKPAKMSLEIDGGSMMKKIANKATKAKKNSERNEVGFFSINIISYNMKVMLTRSILTGIWISHTCEEEKKEGFSREKPEKKSEFSQEKPEKKSEISQDLREKNSEISQKMREKNSEISQEMREKSSKFFHEKNENFSKKGSFFHFPRKTVNLPNISRISYYNSNMFLETKRIPIHNSTSDDSKSIFELTMIIYAPQMFKKLLNFDKDLINFELSLNLQKNDENIKKANKTKGKSGEFFFTSHDNKLIIKTLSSCELRIFLCNFEHYYSYLTTHKDSLITKIYGVYTFFRKDIEISNHVIIMRNIVNSSKKSLLVSYDLKGSTFDREVLKDCNDKEAAYKKKTTLKDHDFLKFERKIEISAVFKEKLLRSLQEDTAFFRKLGFMDYSLFLVKVRKNSGAGLLTENPSNPSNPLYSIESLSEEGVYYNVGIIDYFQKYTAKKFIEKYWKKLVHADYALDTSSQDPKLYAARFMKFMNEIIQ